MAGHEFQGTSDRAAIVASIRTTGVALIRGGCAIKQDWATRFVDRLERVGRGEEDGTPFVTHYQIGASSIEFIGPEVREWYLASPLADIARDYFDGDVFVDRDFSRARIARPPVAALFGSHGFHQDAIGVAYACDDPQQRPPMLTFWVTLTDAGVTAPGLEYVPIAVSERRELKEGGHWTEPTDTSDPALLAAIEMFGAENLVHPAFQAGDVLILSENTYHRTYATRDMTQARVSMDIRVRKVKA
jgi:hypothetical protein